MNLTFHNFAEPKIFMLNLNKNGTWTSFLYIKNLIYNLKWNLKFETFLYHRTFLCKVHELLLIPPLTHTHTHTHTHTQTLIPPLQPFLKNFIPPLWRGWGIWAVPSFINFYLCVQPIELKPTSINPSQVLLQDTALT